MTTVPGTYFTKEQLEADLKGNIYFYFLYSHFKQANELAYIVDNVSGADRTDTNRMYQLGNIYYTEKKQYDKALAWYLLAARENSCDAQNNIGVLYYYGYGVPKNYMCALKWQLKAAEQNDDNKNHKNIGMYFEYGINVPLDKYKALEWYCHSKNKQFINKLKGQGYHRSATDKSMFKSIIDSLY
jgi:TPR repeat protein